MAYLAMHPALCGLKEIAENEKIPPVYLRKVLGELRRHRLLRSVRGLHGGYELARAPEAITLLDVFQVLEPDPYLDACILGHEVCKAETACALHAEWQGVREEIVRLLQSKTISDLAQATAIDRPVSITESDSRWEAQENSDEWER